MSQEVKKKSSGGQKFLNLEERINFHLSKELKDELDNKAKKRGMPVSVLLRTIIEDYLQK